MVVVSVAVTLTLMVFAPGASATCWPVAVVSASPMALSPASRYSTVAPFTPVVGVMVISSTALPTEAV